MERDQDNKRTKQAESSGEEGRPVVGDDDGVIACAYYAEDDEDHERTESPQRGTELEDVPGHDYRPRSHRPNGSEGDRLLALLRTMALPLVLIRGSNFRVLNEHGKGNEGGRSIRRR